MQPSLRRGIRADLTTAPYEIFIQIDRQYGRANPGVARSRLPNGCGGRRHLGRREGNGIKERTLIGPHDVNPASRSRLGSARRRHRRRINSARRRRRTLRVTGPCRDPRPEPRVGCVKVGDRRRATAAGDLRPGAGHGKSPLSRSSRAVGRLRRASSHALQQRIVAELPAT